MISHTARNHSLQTKAEKVILIVVVCSLCTQINQFVDGLKHKKTD